MSRQELEMCGYEQMSKRGYLCTADGIRDLQLQARIYRSVNSSLYYILSARFNVNVLHDLCIVKPNENGASSLVNFELVRILLIVDESLTEA